MRGGASLNSFWEGQESQRKESPGPFPSPPPFTQRLNFIPEAKNTFAQHRHFTPKNITLMDHFGSTMVKIFSNIHDIEYLL